MSPHQVKQLLANGPQPNNAQIGTPGSTSGITVEERGDGIFQHTVITLTNVTVAITDSGGTVGTGTDSANGGYGSLLVYTLPVGLQHILAARTKFTGITRVGTAISATAAVKHSLGTVAVSSSDTLTSTLADILPSTSATLSSGTVATANGVNTGTKIVNGTSSAGNIYLNFGIADAGILGSDSITVSGKVKLTWLVGSVD